MAAVKSVVFALNGLALAQAGLNATAGSNCDYVSDKVQYFDVDKITTAGPIHIGKAPLPEKIQGVFWLVDDGGDALVSLGGDDENGECNNGRLVEESVNWWSSEKQYCTTVSTVRPGGWTFQAKGTPHAGDFPTMADSFYRSCGSKWKYCFDSATDPKTASFLPLTTRAFPCVNLFALSTTEAEYKGKKQGGEYWRVTTKIAGIPVPPSVPGNFDMIQVMDAQGNKIQPAWDEFAKANKQIVYYTGEAEDASLTENGKEQFTV